MRYFLCLVAILPCLLAAEVKPIFCPDGKECPFHKTCCELSDGDFECCDMPEEELLKQELVPAQQPISTVNESLALSQTQNAYCPGTSCGSGLCCNKMYNAVCCSNRLYCCGSGSKCCSNSYTSQPWCCGRRQLCHPTWDLCLGGAASFKVALLPLLLAFAMGVVSRYLF